MIEYTEDNIEKLAREVVEGMSLGDLYEYALYDVTELYREDKEHFEDDWNLLYGED